MPLVLLANLFWCQSPHCLNEVQDTLLVVFNWDHYAQQHLFSPQSLHQNTSADFRANVYLHWREIALNSTPTDSIYSHFS